MLVWAISAAMWRLSPTPPRHVRSALVGPKAREWRSLSEDEQKAIAAADDALDGYFIYEGETLEDVIKVAARVPAARMGGAIEVRPTVEWSAA